MDSLVRAKFRVKIKSLAAEARIIRAEELRAKRVPRGEDGTPQSRAWCYAQVSRESLHEHRVGILRRESRATLLAYAFARGVPHEAVEKSAKQVDVKRVMEIIKSLTYKTAAPAEILDWAARSLAPA